MTDRPDPSTDSGDAVDIASRPDPTHPTRTVSPADAARRWWYLTRLSWAMRDVPTRDWKETRAALRGDIDAAAREVGMTRALKDLGPTHDLAYQYIAARDGLRHPTWVSGILALGVGLFVWQALVLTYAFGLIDGLLAGRPDGGTATQTVLGIGLVAQTFQTPSAGFGVTFRFTAETLAVPAVLVLLFLLGARAWRLLPRRRPSPLRP